MNNKLASVKYATIVVVVSVMNMKENPPFFLKQNRERFVDYHKLNPIITIIVSSKWREANLVED